MYPPLESTRASTKKGTFRAQTGTIVHSRIFWYFLGPRKYIPISFLVLLQIKILGATQN